jgi:hypothetical protein
MNLPICMLGLTTMLVTTAPVLGRAETLVRVEGTEFVLTTAEGVTLRSADLQGATLKIRIVGRDIPVRVERVEEDADAVGGRVVLHHFVVRNENGITVDLCEPDAEGRSLGFPVPDGRSGFELTCTSGAIGKCIACAASCEMPVRWVPFALVAASASLRSQLDRLSSSREATASIRATSALGISTITTFRPSMTLAM